MASPPPSAPRPIARVRFNLPRRLESESEAEKDLLRRVRKTISHAASATGVVRRWISAPNVCKITRANLENFRMLSEAPRQHFRSAQDLRAKMNSWGFSCDQERDIIWNKMDRVWNFLVDNHYVSRNLSHLSVQDFLSTSDAAFEIFEFICHQRGKYLPVPLPGDDLNRSEMIAFMLRLGSMLNLTKPLRKSDLLNPVAKFSKPRVIDFFYQLIEHIEKVRDKGVTLRRHQQF